jgi:hypothetical protein
MYMKGRERKGEREKEGKVDAIIKAQHKSDLMAPALRRKLDDIILAVLKERERTEER